MHWRGTFPTENRRIISIKKCFIIGIKKNVIIGLEPIIFSKDCRVEPGNDRHCKFIWRLHFPVCL